MEKPFFRADGEDTVLHTTHVLSTRGTTVLSLDLHVRLPGSGIHTVYERLHCSTMRQDEAGWADFNLHKL